MRIAILTNQDPPNVYGGAGVHVKYLTRELPAHRGKGQDSVEVICFGGQEIRDGEPEFGGLIPSFEAALPGPRSTACSCRRCSKNW